MIVDNATELESRYIEDYVSDSDVVIILSEVELDGIEMFKKANGENS